MSESFTPVVKKHNPAPNLPQNRYGGAGACIDNYIYYVGGGTMGPSADTPNLFRLKVDDQGSPAAAGWEILPDMPTPRTLVGSAVVGKKIYVFGGLLNRPGASFSNDIHCFDTAANSWSRVGSLATARVGAACVAVGDTIYIIGGNGYLPGGGAGPMASCEAFRTSDNTVSALPAMPAAKGYHGAAAWNGKLYAVGGSGPSFAFDIASSAWSAIAGPQFNLKSPETRTVIGFGGWIFLFGACEVLGQYDNQCHLYDIAGNRWTMLENGGLIQARALSGVAGRITDDMCTIYVMGGNRTEVNNQPINGVDRFVVQVQSGKSLIDSVQETVKDYFNHLSGPAYVRLLDTPHVWGQPFGKAIMPQALVRQAEFERAIVEIVQKAKYRCDLSSLNSPDPDWVRAILGAMDTSLTKVMGRKQPTQFRFLFGQTPVYPISEPPNYADFKAALIRLFRERARYWEVMPEIWFGRFYRLEQGILSAIQAKVFGSDILGGTDTKMTWNHTKIISVDGSEALVGGHNLNMDLFRSYPPVHDVSLVVHGEAAYGAQLFLNQMWVCGTDLLTKEALATDKLSWVNRDKEGALPQDPLQLPEAQSWMKERQDALLAMHRSGVQPGHDDPQPSGEQPVPPGIRDQDLQTLADLRLEVFQERITYNTYEGFADYKLATRMLALGKYWKGPDQTTEFQKASELMKQKLILTAQRTIRMSQMDIVSAWKKNWSDHTVCQWVLQALLANPALVVQIVVSPLDAGAGAEGDQYSFGSGASRTFDLLKYYMTHDAATDAPLDDRDGARARALARLHVAPFYYTDQVPAAKTIEGETYKWPDLSPEGYTATLKQPPLSVQPPVKGVIGSAAMAVINASGYIYSKVPSAPGNHAKIMIVDDAAYVIGSDNLYPGYLSEVDYLVEGADAVNELIGTYWNPLWQYSGPHSISGAGARAAADASGVTKELATTVK